MRAVDPGDSLQARVRASRRAQGLPDNVEDPVTLARVASILSGGDSEPVDLRTLEVPGSGH
jgi:hypothetical protein